MPTNVDHCLLASKYPSTSPIGVFGPWSIIREPLRTVLKYKNTEVMNDSEKYLSRHKPIWRRGRGRILVTGLGLGCVVRGLLARPQREIAAITVIESDRHLLEAVGPEFKDHPRIELVLADYLLFEPGDRQWDYAWHDVWVPTVLEGGKIPVIHSDLITKYVDYVRYQGAWGMPKFWYKMIGGNFYDREAPIRRRRGRKDEGNC